jgi:tetratricopeptide (TPR) repeat protein
VIRIATGLVCGNRLSLFCFVTALTCCLGAMASAADAPPPPPKSEKEPRIEAVVPGGRAKLEKGEWDAVIAETTVILNGDAENVIALLMRGTALNGKGDYDAAIKDLTKASSKPSSDLTTRDIRADAYSNLSVSYYRKDKFLPAIDNAWFALLEKGDHFEAHNNRALAYIGRGQYDKAIGSADAAIRAKEDFAEGFSTRGLAYFYKNNFDQALKDQSKAIELQSKLAVAYQRRAAASAAKGELPKALEDLDKAITAKPDFADAICDRACLYGMARNLPKMVSELDGLIKSNPSYARAYYHRAMLNVDQKKYDLAMDDLDQAIKLKDNFAAAYCLRGYAQTNRKNLDDAVADFTKAIESDSRLVNAYKGRAAAYQKLKKIKEAKADQDKVAELQPPPPPKPAANAKKSEDPTPRFTVSSKEVSPTKLKEALKSAAEIDKQVQANYKKFDITPLPKTPDEQFLRRVYLDVTGTIPSYQNVKKFRNNNSANKRAELIDELLNSPAYAGNFFNYWADVLRYTDNLNGNVRGEPYRQWIKQSLAENKPWDKMVYEMLTASGRVWENPATGYFQRDPNMPLDVMNNTVRIFLGTRIGCAQCHNHPFDRWTQKEFYEMAAFTFGTQQSTHGGDKRFWNSNPHERLQADFAEIEQEEEDRRNNYYRFDRMIGVNLQIVNDQVDRKIQLPANYAYDNAKPNETVAPRTLFGPQVSLKPGETPRQGFARWCTASDNPRFAKVIANRLWKQVFGVGQIEPVDDMMDDTVAENPALMDHLEAEMKRLNFDMKEYLRILLNTETYQRQACVDEMPLGAPYHFPGPMLRRMSAEQVWDSFLTLSVVDPDEFRELPAKVRTDVIGFNLDTVSAKKVLDAESKGSEIDYGVNSKRQQKYTYKGILLARASELPSPVPANHFLRSFGQSDRELISASSSTGSVPQVLFMFNGPITHMLLEKNSTIYINVVKQKNVNDATKVIFETILTREPDADELALAVEEVKRNGPAGFGNVIWSLVNTREFLFIQ